MKAVSRESSPPTVDPDAGVWRDRSVARRFVSPDGWTILVGRSARDNDLLTFKLASQRDFWLHVASDSGSHVVVLNPERKDRLPRETLRLAASLAAGYSKARSGGRVPVHVATVADVSRIPGAPAGKVAVKRSRTVTADPVREP